MSATIYVLQKPKSEEARTALMRIFRDPASQCLSDWDVPAVTDYILGRLYESGFVIRPLENK
jgi:hypothetical protein